MDLKVGLAESFNQIKISGYWMMTTKFDKFPTNGGGLERLGWFPTLYWFLIMKASLIIKLNTENKPLRERGGGAVQIKKKYTTFSPSSPNL